MLAYFVQIQECSPSVFYFQSGNFQIGVKLLQIFLQRVQLLKLAKSKLFYIFRLGNLNFHYKISSIQNLIVDSLEDTSNFNFEIELVINLLLPLLLLAVCVYSAGCLDFAKPRLRYELLAHKLILVQCFN